MKHLLVKIKNLGRISEADIRLGGFTVFAGKNNTGKSFASKAIYSLLRGLNGVSLHDDIDDWQSKLLRYSRIIEGERKDKGLKQKGLQEQIESLFEDVSNVDTSGGIVEHFHQKRKDISELSWSFDVAGGIETRVDALPESEEAEEMSPHLTRRRVYANRAHRYLDNLGNLPLFLRADIAKNISDHLLGNFQTIRKDDIFRDVGTPICVELEGITRFKWGEGECAAEFDDVDKLTNFSTLLPPPFFIESPAHAKLKVALDTLGRSMFVRRFRARAARKALVPTHYVDLHNALGGTLVTDDGHKKFKDIAKGIFETIGGELEVLEDDDILYHSKTDGKKHKLPLAATGIANLGMLGLMMGNGLLEKGSYLFIDEPEAHLHPEWQVRMADALFALVENGVNVVIATHSNTLLKWIEVKTRERPELEKSFAINHFVDGTVVRDDKANFQQQLNTAKSDVSEPYGELYLRGLDI